MENGVLDYTAKCSIPLCKYDVLILQTVLHDLSNLQNRGFWDDDF